LPVDEVVVHRIIHACVYHIYVCKKKQTNTAYTHTHPVLEESLDVAQAGIFPAGERQHLLGRRHLVAEAPDLVCVCACVLWLFMWWGMSDTQTPEQFIICHAFLCSFAYACLVVRLGGVGQREEVGEGAGHLSACWWW
jgi:hypothetical protein